MMHSLDIEVLYLNQYLKQYLNYSIWTMEVFLTKEGCFVDIVKLFGVFLG